MDETFLLIELSNVLMVKFLLSDIKLIIFFPSNPAIYRIGNALNILCARCKKQNWSPPHFIFYSKLFKITLGYISEIIELRWELGMKILWNMMGASFQ